ncbi:MAG: hypothetical protein ACJ79S_22170 [Gemmatimonadaceae bacterium]
MRPLRLLSWPTYLVATLLIFVPFLDWAVAVWPLQPGNMRWRVAAVGQLSGGLMTVLLGLLLLFAVALLLEQPRVQRLVAALAGLLAAGTLVAIVLFLLDAVQLRGSVRPELVHSFDAVAIQALVKQLLALATSIALAVCAARASRASGEARRARATKPGAGVVVGGRVPETGGAK